MPNKLPLPPRLPLARLPTPLEFLPRASERWGRGRRLWIKRDDLSGTTLTGNKVRKLEFIAAYAQTQGVDTLITCGGTQSNHARATAAVCAQLGWHCQLLLRGEALEASGNTLLDALFGAELTRIPTASYQANLDQHLAEAAARQCARGRTPLIIPTGGSNGLGLWGYVAGAEELLEDLEREGIADATVVCATGSGGTQAGLTLGMDHVGERVDVIGMAVCDDANWFNNKVYADIAEARVAHPNIPALRHGPRTIDDYIGPGYGIAEPRVYALIQELAALEGVVLDPVYTGKAFLGMVETLADGSLSDKGDVVFVHTGGIFGLFPHHKQFGHLVPDNS